VGTQDCLGRPPVRQIVGKRLTYAELTGKTGTDAVSTTPQNF